MADFALLFNPGIQKVSIAVMELDASLDETHELKAFITRNEVEDGPDISDHAKLEPRHLTIHGIISDSPLTLFSAAVGTAVGAAGQMVTKATGVGVAGAIAATGLALGAGSIASLAQKSKSPVPRNPSDCYRYLVELWQNRTPFDIVTKLTKYSNMMISSISIPKASKIGRSLEFTAQFEQVIIVKSSTVQVASTQHDPKHNPNKTADTGKQSPETPKPATDAQAQSVLRFLQVNL